MTAYLSVRLGISFAGTLLLSRWAAAFVPNEVVSEKVALVWRFGNSCQHGGKKKKKTGEATPVLCHLLPHPPHASTNAGCGWV